ncbi:MAG: hypothetical protein WCW30_01515 [Candidatus Gracilibacteria bacterium]
MSISKPAVVATMLAALPLTADAQGMGVYRVGGEPTVEVTGPNLMNVCTVPSMTVGQLNGHATSLGESLGRAVEVTDEEQSLAQEGAQGKLDAGKKALEARVGTVVKGTEALKVEMQTMLNGLPTDAPASDFAKGGAKRTQLQGWKEKLEAKKAELDAISAELPLLTARVRVTDGGIRLEDVRSAFKTWEKVSGINCPDSVETSVATNRSFPTSVDKNEKKEGSKVPDASLGLAPEADVLNRDSMEKPSPLWAFVNEVEILKAQATSLVEEANELSGRITAMAVPQER